jgi:hypothetical protein
MVRKKIADLQAEISDVERRPLNSAYCRKKAKAQIEMLAARGKPDVRALVARDGAIQFATERHSHNLNGFDAGGRPISGIAAWEQPDLLALFCHVHKAAMQAAVDTVIAAEVDDTKAMIPETKEKTMAELRVRWLQAERDLCSLTWVGIDQKLPVEFGDADPRAVLGVDLVFSPRPLPSLEHAFGVSGR